MSARFMLDKDTCIYLKNRRPPSVAERFSRMQWGDVVMSMVTYGELLSGARKSRESVAALENIKRLGERLPVQPMSTEVAETYGVIRSTLELQGNIIGGNNLWIAAHAITLDLTLVTNNADEFKRVDGLKFENWLD